MEKRIEEIAKHYGYEKQKMKLVEEVGELLQAISKLDDARPKSLGYLNAKDHLLEEIADVSIMTDQIVCLLNGEGRTEAKRTEKLDRQIKRIEEENKENTTVNVVYGIHGIHAGKRYQEYCWRLPLGMAKPKKGDILRVYTKNGVDNIYVTKTGEMPYSKAKDLKAAAGHVQVNTDEQ